MIADADLIGRLIAREGGYVSHPHDKGGSTKYGITKRTLSEWRGRAVTEAEVKALSEREARDIYAAIYLAPFKDVTDADVRELLFDSAVLHGVGRAKRWLQMALGVEPDGVIGPETRGAMRLCNWVDVYRGVLRARLVAIGKTITADSTQAVFAAGWITRAAAFI